MKTDGQNFLEQLASFPANTFEGRFLKTSIRLSLGHDLDSDELSLLYRAAFRAALCNIAFNGLGGCNGEIKAEQEGSRLRLEREFMIARDRLYATCGWKTLAKSQKESIENVLLRVVVEDRNLAD